MYDFFLIPRIKFLILKYFVSAMVRPTLDGEDGCGFDNFFLTLVRPSTDRPTGPPSPQICVCLLQFWMALTVVAGLM